MRPKGEWQGVHRGIKVLVAVTSALSQIPEDALCRAEEGENAASRWSRRRNRAAASCKAIVTWAEALKR